MEDHQSDVTADMPPRPLRIAVIAHLRHPIRPPFMGGMESHTHRLVQLLLNRGHQVTLVATADSDPALPVLPALPEGYEATFPAARWHDTGALHGWLDDEWCRIGGLLADLDVDVLHNNSLHPEPLRTARDRRIPIVTTLHVPPFHTLREAVRGITAPWMITTLPSTTQIDRWWDAPPDRLRIIPNGIDLTRWGFVAAGDGTAIWCGRIAPNKGPALAAQAARMAGVPLTLYGSIEDRAYFEADVAPWLGDGVGYGGHLSGSALAAAVGRASVSLFTPMWDEPFGLTAAEALACGVPVAAFDNGAAREVIGECGRYAAPGDVAGLALALRQALAIPRDACRARAEARFGETAMIAAYERTYSAAICAAADARSLAATQALEA